MNKEKRKKIVKLITIILLTIIIVFLCFFNKNWYIDIFFDNFSIDLSSVSDQDNYKWYVDLSKPILDFEQKNNKFNFTVNNNGTILMVFKYKKNEEDEDYKYKIVYRFKLKHNRAFWVYSSSDEISKIPKPF